MENVLRISSPYSEGWVAWIMLLCLACMILAVWLQPNIMKNSVHSLGENKLRGNQLNNTSFTFFGSGLLLLSNIMAFSLLVFLYCSGKHDTFSFSGYMLTCALFVCMWIIQDLLFRIVSFVFLNREMLRTYHYYRLTLNTFLTWIIYPVLLLMMFTPWFDSKAVSIALLMFLVTLFCLIAFKLFRLFSSGFLDYLYILLYLCTLEVLPFLGWIYATCSLLGTI